ncbi:MAG: ribonuclease P protein component [Muribaculaceae bacterium]|nr:ribonuclease P protein component [Muribaculaceae bacterium]
MTESHNPSALTLNKAERLRHRTLVEDLFKEGETLYDWPLRLTCRTVGEEKLAASFRNVPPAGIGDLQMLITVPKKKIRHAVDRVRLRRRIREAYRLNRLPLKAAVAANPEIRVLEMAFIYIGNQETDYALIEKKMRRLLAMLAERVSKIGYSKSL